MYPEIFGFLPSFGVIVATGFLVGVSVWRALLKRHGLHPEQDPDHASDVAVWVLVGVIGGARLLYAGVESSRYLSEDITPAMETYLAENRLTPELTSDELARARRVAVGYDFLHDPLKLLFIWQGGLVMYGGLVGAMLLGTWASRRRGFSPWNALDTGLTAGFIGQAIGRWGCLLVGDDYGSVVPEAWKDAFRPITLPSGGEVGPLTIRVPSAEWLADNPKSLFEDGLAGEVLWATQPWMSVNALCVALVAYLVLKRRTAFGQVAGVVLIHYSITRAAIEMFRGDDVRGVWFGGALSTSQLIGVLGALGGVLLLATAKRRPLPKSLAPATASEPESASA